MAMTEEEFNKLKKQIEDDTTQAKKLTFDEFLNLEKITEIKLSKPELRFGRYFSDIFDKLKSASNEQTKALMPLFINLLSELEHKRIVVGNAAVFELNKIRDSFSETDTSGLKVKIETYKECRKYATYYIDKGKEQLQNIETEEKKIIQDKEDSLLKQTREKAVANVELALNKIKEKLKPENIPATFLKPVRETTAKKAAEELCDFMDKIIKEYKTDLRASDKGFQDVATIVLGNEQQYKTIEDSLKKDNKEIDERLIDLRKKADILKTHRQYKNLILNVLLAILSIPLLGIPYGAGVLMTKRLGVFNIPTDTAKKMSDVLSEVEKVSPKK